MTSLVLVLTAVFACCCAMQRRYDGYKLLRTIPHTDDDVSSLQVLRDMADGDEVDFWNDINNKGMPIDILVSPEKEGTLMTLLEEYGFIPDVVIEDVQVLIDEQMRPSHSMDKRDAPSADSFNYTRYHTLAEITDWMDDIVTAYPNIVSKVPVGSSYEHRVIYALKIGRDSPTGVSKPVVWLQAGIHAREWIAPAVIIFITNKLVSNYGSHDEITSFLDGLDIYIIPVLNVDGYVFTWTNDRLWRKTRSDNADSDCIGTDANRNYDWHWGEAGADIYPCNNTYAGHEATSEIEVHNTTQYLSNLVDSGVNISLFMDFHSYSRVWLCPWGYTKDRPDDFADLNNLQAEAVAAVNAYNGSEYTHGSIANAMYVSSGTSVDWAYAVLGIKYSYTVELPDEGLHGFILPDRFIQPTANEIFEGLKVMLNHIL